MIDIGNQPAITFATSVVFALPLVSTPVMLHTQTFEVVEPTSNVSPHTGPWWPKGPVGHSTTLIFNADSDRLTTSTDQRKGGPNQPKSSKEMLLAISSISNLNDSELADIFTVSRNAIQLWKKGGGIRPSNQQMLGQLFDIVRRVQDEADSSTVRNWILTPTLEHGVSPAELIKHHRYDEARLAASLGSSQVESLFADDEWSPSFLNTRTFADRSELDS